MLGGPSKALLAAKDASEVAELVGVTSCGNRERELIITFFEIALYLCEVKHATSGFQWLDIHRALGACDLEPPVLSAERIAVIATEGHRGLRVFQDG